MKTFKKFVAESKEGNELAWAIINLSNEIIGEKDVKKLALLKRDLAELRDKLEKARI